MSEQIPEKMQAVICHGPENYALEQVPVPTPGPREALVKVEQLRSAGPDLEQPQGVSSR